MKKALSLALAVIMTASLTACGSKHESAVPANAPTDLPSETKGTVDRMPSSSSTESSDGLSEEMKHFDFDGDGVLSDEEMEMYMMNGYSAEHGVGGDAGNNNFDYISYINQYRQELAQMKEQWRHEFQMEEIDRRLTPLFGESKGTDDILGSLDQNSGEPNYKDWISDIEGVIPDPSQFGDTKDDAVNTDPSCDTIEECEQKIDEFYHKSPSYYNAHKIAEYMRNMMCIELDDWIRSLPFEAEAGYPITMNYEIDRYNLIFDILKDRVVYCSNTDYMYFWVTNPELLSSNGATVSCDLLESSNMIRHYDIKNVGFHPSILELLQNDKKNDSESNNEFYKKNSVILVGEMVTEFDNIPVEITINFSDYSRGDTNKVILRYQYSFDSPVQEAIGSDMVRSDMYTILTRSENKYLW